MSEISIIIPVYNTSLYLSECLESVLAQGVDDMEIIVINDCSTDTSAEIINNYAERDKRIKPIHLKKNIGVGAARNVGIESAKGAWLAMVDSDDIMQENSLARLLETARSYNSDVIIGSVTVQRDNADGTFEIESFMWSQSFDFTVANTNLDCCPSLINVRSCWSNIYNRKFLVDSGIVFRRRMQEDADFVLNVLLEAEKISIRGDIPYIRYRKRYTNNTDPSQSITQSTWSPERFDMMVDHLNRVITLLYTDVYVAKIKAIEQLRKAKLSHYLGYFTSSILNYILSLDEHADYLKSLEKMADLFEQSGLRETGLDLTAQTLANTPYLVDTGYYELALNLIIERRWSTLRMLFENKALEVKEVACMTRNEGLSLPLKNSLQAYMGGSKKPLIYSEKWQPRLVPHTIKEVVLHIGMTKTGSTAIQNFLERNRGVFCKNGVLYPQTGLHFEVRRNSIRTSGHQHLMLASKRRDTDFIAKFCSEIETTPEIRKVVVSAENMFLEMSDSEIENLRKQLGSVDTKIVVYLRRQDVWLESMYNEAISGSHLKESRFFSDFVESHKAQGSIDYAGRLNGWARFFGQENIIVRPYEKELLNEGTISDFCKVTGLDGIVSDDKQCASERNISPLAKDDLLVLRAMNKLPFDMANIATSYRPFIHAYVDRYGSLNNSGSVRWFSEQDRQQILSEYAASNKDVVKTFLPEKSQRLFSSPVPEDVVAEVENHSDNISLPEVKLGFALSLYNRYNKPEYATNNVDVPISSDRCSKPVHSTHIVDSLASPGVETLRVRPFVNIFVKTEMKIKERLAIARIKKSGLFDNDWYLNEYPDVSASGIDPVYHFVRFGAAELRNPSEDFDTRRYLDNNEDVKSSQLNPLYHFIKFGMAEGREK